MQTKSKKTLFYILIILGILVAIFLLYEHYNPSPSKFCNFGKSFDCGIVNKSPYSTLDGIFYLLAVDFKISVPIYNVPIPVAGVGILTLIILGILGFSIFNNKAFLGILLRKALLLAKILLILALLFSLYLFLIEIFLLKTFCIFCIALDIIFILMTVIIFTAKIQGETA